MTHNVRCAGAGLGPRPRSRPDSVAARLVLPFDSLVPLSLEPREEAGSAVSAMLFRCAGGGESSTAGSCGGLTEIAPLIGRQGRVFTVAMRPAPAGGWTMSRMESLPSVVAGMWRPLICPQTAGSCRDASAGLGGHGLRDMRAAVRVGGQDRDDDRASGRTEGRALRHPSAVAPQPTTCFMSASAA